MVASPKAEVTSGARRFFAVLFAIPIAFSVLFFVANAAAARIDTRLIKIETLRDRISGLRAIANDAEAGEQGYLLRGDERYRNTLVSATIRLSQLPNADADTDVNQLPPNLRDQFHLLVRLVRERVQIANEVLRVQREDNYGAALDAEAQSQAEVVMDDIRSITLTLQQNLSAASSERFEEYRGLTRAGFLLFLFGTMVMLIVMVWLYNTFLAQIRARGVANEELQKLNSELEARITERTRELQDFNEELQQFAYVASHDLQEPLRTITSFTQLLAGRYRGKLDGDADEFMEYIVTSARRMTDLINGLLALVRLRKSSCEARPVPFAALVREAEISLQAAIRESGARIETENLPTLVLDGVQFAQVLQNLISNAIKYRLDDAPFVRIRGRREPGAWVISVEDNGRGFDPQFSERIFGIFQRLQPREVAGTGMGLTIVKRIVERHGGRIWAESGEGRGSTFFISLPLSLEIHTPESDISEPATTTTGR